jgi:hypothetical protein
LTTLRTVLSVERRFLHYDGPRESARARKGSSWDHVARMLDHADPSLKTRTGLSTARD